MLKLYDFLDSGNGYKVRLTLAQLGIPYELLEVDILTGGSRTPEFLARNPNGRIPLLEFEDGRRLAESNAIICYLADGTPLLPGDRWLRAQVLQWMFFEQYSHEPNIATARFWVKHLQIDDLRRRMLEDKIKAGNAALGVMERHLADHAFFVDERYSVADIALFAYTHVAGEAGFDLAAYPAVQAWIARVREQSGHKPITSR